MNDEPRREERRKEPIRWISQEEWERAEEAIQQLTARLAERDHQNASLVAETTHLHEHLESCHVRSSKLIEAFKGEQQLLREAYNLIFSLKHAGFRVPDPADYRREDERRSEDRERKDERRAEDRERADERRDENRHRRDERRAEDGHPNEEGP